MVSISPDLSPFLPLGVLSHNERKVKTELLDKHIIELNCTWLKCSSSYSVLIPSLFVRREKYLHINQILSNSRLTAQPISTIQGPYPHPVSTTIGGAKWPEAVFTLCSWGCFHLLPDHIMFTKFLVLKVLAGNNRYNINYINPVFIKVCGHLTITTTCNPPPNNYKVERKQFSQFYKMSL